MFHNTHYAIRKWALSVWSSVCLALDRRAVRVSERSGERALE